MEDQRPANRKTKRKIPIIQRILFPLQPFTMPALTLMLFLPPHAEALSAMGNITGFVPSKEQFPHSSTYSWFSEAQFLFSLLILVSVHRGSRLAIPVCMEKVVIYLVQRCCASPYPPKNLEKTLATFKNGKMPLHHLENGMGNAKEFWNGQEGAK